VQPPGVSSGYTPVWLPPIATLPAERAGVAHPGAPWRCGNPGCRERRSRYETEQIHAVIRAGVNRGDFFGREPMLAGNLFQVFAESVAVTDRNLHQASRSQFRVGLRVQPRFELLDQGFVGVVPAADTAGS